MVQKETGQSKTNIIGHSMGGKAVSYFAIQDSNQPFINKLIVEDVTPTRASDPALFLGYVEALQKLDLSKPRREILLDLEQVVPDLKVRQFLLTNLVMDSSGPNRFKWKINLAGVGNSLQHVIGFKLDSGKFDGSTLFLYGENSDFVQENDKSAIKRFFPNVVFKSIASGHWLHAEQPTLFIESVVEFLSSN